MVPVFPARGRLSLRAPLPEARLARLAKKIAAGAQFVQTQYCFDLERLERYMALVRATGLHERIRILAGVGPIASATFSVYQARSFSIFSSLPGPMSVIIW